MRQSGLISVLLLSAIVMSVSGNPNRADDGASGHRKALAEYAGGSVARACMRANCATVLALRHGDLEQSPPPAYVQGPLQRQPPFGPYDPHVPPIAQPSFMVKKHKDIWVVEVLRRDGTIQTIEQSYPAFFQVGDEVLVEGDRIRVPD